MSGWQGTFGFVTVEVVMRSAFVFSAFTMLLASAATRSAEWTPPEKPVPTDILREAKMDEREGRFEDALAKHVWYHEHALEYDRGQTGVRLSFALSHWLDLAEKYPPALVKLKEIRDATHQRVKPGGDREIAFTDFHTLTALNRTLKDHANTVAAFKRLDEEAPEEAKRVFDVSRPALIAAAEYKVFAKYITPKESADGALRDLEAMRKLAKDPRFAVAKLSDRAEERFINEAATLVAILIKAERLKDAANAVAALRRTDGDAEFKARFAAALDDALDGILPEPLE